MKAEVVAAEPWHAEAIGKHVRDADVDELWSGARATPAMCMEYGMRFNARTGLVDGAPVCMFGVVPFSLLMGSGTPWMVTTTTLDDRRVWRAFALHSRIEFEAIKARHNVLWNVVDERNDNAKRWLRWLGFELGVPFIYGKNGEPFRAFQWERTHVE